MCDACGAAMRLVDMTPGLTIELRWTTPEGKKYGLRNRIAKPEGTNDLSTIVQSVTKVILDKLQAAIADEKPIDPEHAEPAAPRMRAPEKIDVMPRVLNSKAWKDRP